MDLSFEEQQVIRDALRDRTLRYIGYLDTAPPTDFIYAEIWRCWKLYLRFTDSVQF